MNLATRLLPCLLAIHSLAAQEAPDLALGGLDPVELTRGKEVPGRKDITQSRHLFLYRFASPESREVFAKQPATYEIQMGGGCGRMGPRSGRGSPDRFAVHDGRIYVFASESCRTAFLKNPPIYLDPDDPAPSAAGGEGAAARGRALLELAVGALGGRDRLARLAACEIRAEQRTKVKDGERLDSTVWTIAFPDRIRSDEAIGDWRMAVVSTPGGGTTLINGGKTLDPEDLHATAARELRRTVLRHPLVLLRLADPAAGAVHAGTRTTGDTTLEEIAVACEGTTTTLGIDPASGRVVAASFRGRGPRMWFGAMTVTYADFKEVSGIPLPHAASVRFEGDDSARASTLSYRLDPPIDATTWKLVPDSRPSAR